MNKAFTCVNGIPPVSPLALNAETFPKVLTIVDSSIATSSSVFAVHALSSSSTVFLSGTDILAYLRKLETDDVKIQELGFESIAGGSVAAATQTSKAPVKEKEDAKIEGAVQIAIGVKKEVDFAAWYTNVSTRYSGDLSKLIFPQLGPPQSRHARLL